MAIKICPNGHRYNTEMNESCPICERERQGGGDFGWGEVDLSMETRAQYGGGGWSEFQATEVSTGSDIGWSDVSVPTERSDRLPDSGFGSDPTQIIGADPTAGRKDPWDENLDPTKRVGRKGPETLTPATEQIEYQKQPVVGWLVCIEGPDKGRDFPLHGAKSTIGRKPGSSVLLSDMLISRDGFPALIVYDTKKTHKFYLASGDAASQNNVELGGELLLGQSVINPYDEIRIENTTLVFVPFCGDDFYWEEN